MSLADRRYEFVVEVPVTLASSRATHFDRISHHLHAGLLSASPCYDRLIEDGDDTYQSAWTNFLDRLRPKTQARSSVFGSTPILAQAVEPVNVFSYGSGVGNTALDWRYSEPTDELGHLAIVLNSQQFILGQIANLSIDVTGLSPDTTIHSLTTSLVQTTTQATCPSKYAAPNTPTRKDLDDRTELSDKYELYTLGPTVGARMPGRQRPSLGSYIWRGMEGAKYLTKVPDDREISVDRLHDDGFGLSATLCLPSPIIGAHSTTINENPAFSTISHYMEFQFDYSILNQDIRGSILPGTGCAPEEGPIRSWKLRYHLDVHSDLSSATITAAPPYPCLTEPTHRCRPGFDPSMELESTKARRYLSLGWTKATLMRPVAVDRKAMQESTRRHWEEMAGMCACFDRRDDDGTAVSGYRCSGRNADICQAGKNC
jgi:hypothetical protein